MKLIFKSFVDEEKIEFTTDLEIENNRLSFINILDNSRVYIYKSDDFIVLERKGDAKQVLRFKEGTKTASKYENNEGIMFNLEIETLKAKLTEAGFLFHYNLLMDGKTLSNHKILGKVIK